MVKVVDAVNTSPACPVEAVLRHPNLGDAATVKSMLPKWSDPAVRSTIIFELTCLKAVAKRFVEATYLLEGNGPVSMVAFDVIASISAAMTQLLPDMDFAEIQTAAEQRARANLAPPLPAQQVLLSPVKSCSCTDAVTTLSPCVALESIMLLYMQQQVHQCLA